MRLVNVAGCIYIPVLGYSGPVAVPVSSAQCSIAILMKVGNMWQAAAGLVSKNAVQRGEGATACCLKFHFATDVLPVFIVFTIIGRQMNVNVKMTKHIHSAAACCKTEAAANVN